MYSTESKHFSSPVSSEKSQTSESLASYEHEQKCTQLACMHFHMDTQSILMSDWL